MWPTIAAFILLAAVAVGITEMTGLTKLLPQRAAVTTGTLAIEIDDPETYVTITPRKGEWQRMRHVWTVSGQEELTFDAGHYLLTEFQGAEEVSERDIEILPGNRTVAQFTMEHDQREKPLVLPGVDFAAERQVVEFVLSKNGSVVISDGRRKLTWWLGQPLPRAEFFVSKIDFENRALADADLPPLMPARKLELLKLGKTYVTASAVSQLATALPHCKIEWDGGVIEPTVSPDRRAAEWVLSNGGTINIKKNGQEHGTKDVGELPRGDFELTGVELSQNRNVNDVGLAHLKDCKHLTTFSVRSKQVSDVGLAYVKDCKNLTYLAVQETGVTDAGLANFKDCKNLMALSLITANISDVGLAHFKDCVNLTKLHLAETKVSGAGLAHFKDYKNLTFLNLADTQVDDAGMAHLKQCTNLSTLQLYATQVSDTALVHLKECKNLSILNLDRTQVSDAGLEHLVGYPKLAHLIVSRSKVTEAGVKALSAALPGCKIEWDGGVIEPTMSPDRRAAEYVLSIGGNIKIKANGQERQIDAVADLPSGAFELTALILIDNPNVTDEGLAHFKGIKTLTFLYLGGPQVSDAWLANFKDCKNLTYLRLNAFEKVSDAGLAIFKDCKNLTGLELDNTPVSDVGLAHFKECNNLNLLYLGNTKVSDVGLAIFEDCKKLESLILANTQVSDTGLAHFRNWTNLVYVALNGSKVTEAGVKKLSAALPKCKIEWDGGVIEGSQK